MSKDKKILNNSSDIRVFDTAPLKMVANSLDKTQEDVVNLYDPNKALANLSGPKEALVKIYNKLAAEKIKPSDEELKKKIADRNKAHLELRKYIDDSKEGKNPEKKRWFNEYRKLIRKYNQTDYEEFLKEAQPELFDVVEYKEKIKAMNFDLNDEAEFYKQLKPVDLLYLIEYWLYPEEKAFRKELKQLGKKNLDTSDAIKEIREKLIRIRQNLAVALGDKLESLSDEFYQEQAPDLSQGYTEANISSNKLAGAIVVNGQGEKLRLEQLAKLLKFLKEADTQYAFDETIEAATEWLKLVSDTENTQTDRELSELKDYVTELNVQIAELKQEILDKEKLKEQKLKEKENQEQGLKQIELQEEVLQRKLLKTKNSQTQLKQKKSLDIKLKNVESNIQGIKNQLTDNQNAFEVAKRTLENIKEKLADIEVELKKSKAELKEKQDEYDRDKAKFVIANTSRKKEYYVKHKETILQKYFVNKTVDKEKSLHVYQGRSYWLPTINLAEQYKVGDQYKGNIFLDEKEKESVWFFNFRPHLVLRERINRESAKLLTSYDKILSTCAILQDEYTAGAPLGEFEHDHFFGEITRAEVKLKQLKDIHQQYANQWFTWIRYGKTNQALLKEYQEIIAKKEQEVQELKQHKALEVMARLDATFKQKKSSGLPLLSKLSLNRYKDFVEKTLSNVNIIIFSAGVSSEQNTNSTGSILDNNVIKGRLNKFRKKTNFSSQFIKQLEKYFANENNNIRYTRSSAVQELSDFLAGNQSSANTSKKLEELSAKLKSCYRHIENYQAEEQINAAKQILDLCVITPDLCDYSKKENIAKLQASAGILLGQSSDSEKVKEFLENIAKNIIYPKLCKERSSSAYAFYREFKANNFDNDLKAFYSTTYNNLKTLIEELKTAKNFESDSKFVEFATKIYQLIQHGNYKVFQEKLDKLNTNDKPIETVLNLQLSHIVQFLLLAATCHLKDTTNTNSEEESIFVLKELLNNVIDTTDFNNYQKLMPTFSYFFAPDVYPILGEDSTLLETLVFKTLEHFSAIDNHSAKEMLAFINDSCEVKRYLVPIFNRLDLEFNNKQNIYKLSSINDSIEIENGITKFGKLLAYCENPEFITSPAKAKFLWQILNLCEDQDQLRILLPAFKTTLLVNLLKDGSRSHINTYRSILANLDKKLVILQVATDKQFTEIQKNQLINVLDEASCVADNLKTVHDFIADKDILKHVRAVTLSKFLKDDASVCIALLDKMSAFVRENANAQQPLQTSLLKVVDVANHSIETNQDLMALKDAINELDSDVTPELDAFITQFKTIQPNLHVTALSTRVKKLIDIEDEADQEFYYSAEQKLQYLKEIIAYFNPYTKNQPILLLLINGIAEFLVTETTDADAEEQLQIIIEFVEIFERDVKFFQNLINFGNESHNEVTIDSYTKQQLAILNATRENFHRTLKSCMDLIKLIPCLEESNRLAGNAYTEDQIKNLSHIIVNPIYSFKTRLDLLTWIDKYIDIPEVRALAFKEALQALFEDKVYQSEDNKNLSIYINKMLSLAKPYQALCAESVADLGEEKLNSYIKFDIDIDKKSNRYEYFGANLVFKNRDTSLNCFNDALFELIDGYFPKTARLNAAKKAMMHFFLDPVSICESSKRYQLIANCLAEMNLSKVVSKFDLEENKLSELAKLKLEVGNSFLVGFSPEHFNYIYPLVKLINAPVLLSKAKSDQTQADSIYEEIDLKEIFLIKILAELRENRGFINSLDIEDTDAKILLVNIIELARAGDKLSNILKDDLEDYLRKTAVDNQIYNQLIKELGKVGLAEKIHTNTVETLEENSNEKTDVISLTDKIKKFLEEIEKSQSKFAESVEVLARRNNVIQVSNVIFPIINATENHFLNKASKLVRENATKILKMAANIEIFSDELKGYPAYQEKADQLNQLVRDVIIKNAYELFCGLKGSDHITRKKLTKEQQQAYYAFIQKFFVANVKAKQAVQLPGLTKHIANLRVKETAVVEYIKQCEAKIDTCKSHLKGYDSSDRKLNNKAYKQLDADISAWQAYKINLENGLAKNQKLHKKIKKKIATATAKQQALSGLDVEKTALQQVMRKLANDFIGGLCTTNEISVKGYLGVIDSLLESCLENSATIAVAKAAFYTALLDCLQSASEDINISVADMLTIIANGLTNLSANHDNTLNVVAEKYHDSIEMLTRGFCNHFLNLEGRDINDLKETLDFVEKSLNGEIGRDNAKTLLYQNLLKEASIDKIYKALGYTGVAQVFNYVDSTANLNKLYLELVLRNCSQLSRIDENRYIAEFAQQMRLAKQALDTITNTELKNSLLSFFTTSFGFITSSEPCTLLGFDELAEKYLTVLTDFKAGIEKDVATINRLNFTVNFISEENKAIALVMAYLSDPQNSFDINSLSELLKLNVMSEPAVLTTVFETHGKLVVSIFKNSIESKVSNSDLEIFSDAKCITAEQELFDKLAEQPLEIRVKFALLLLDKCVKPLKNINQNMETEKMVSIIKQLLERVNFLTADIKDNEKMQSLFQKYLQLEKLTRAAENSDDGTDGMVYVDPELTKLSQILKEKIASYLNMAATFISTLLDHTVIHKLLASKNGTEFTAKNNKEIIEQLVDILKNPAQFKELRFQLLTELNTEEGKRKRTLKKIEKALKKIAKELENTTDQNQDDKNSEANKRLARYEQHKVKAESVLDRITWYVTLLNSLGIASSNVNDSYMDNPNANSISGENTDVLSDLTTFSCTSTVDPSSPNQNGSPTGSFQTSASFFNGVTSSGNRNNASSSSLESVNREEQNVSKSNKSSEDTSSFNRLSLFLSRAKDKVKKQLTPTSNTNSSTASTSNTPPSKSR